MPLSDLPSKGFVADLGECWERERTATPVRAFAVRLHATGCSLRETATILEALGGNRSYQAIFQWVHRIADSGCDPPSAQPRRVAVDETAVKLNGELSWLNAAIDFDTKLILCVDVFARRGTDSAAAFLRELDEKHDLSENTLLVDGYGYLTALARIELRGRLDYVDRNQIEKWFQTLAMQIDRFHQSWVGSRPSVRRWLAVFVHYYKFHRPHQSLNKRTPAEVLN
jgi:transposase-like protein